MKNSIEIQNEELIISKFSIENEENYNKLKPFIALCRVLNAMHKKYENTDNYTEIIKMCKFLEEEIRYNLDRTY
ncbi:MAG: hypothetical protein ACI4ON_05515 [Clostridia bacterium]